MQYIKNLLVLVLCLLSASAWAQTTQKVTVNGRVTDQAGTPLPYATITVDSLHVGTTTDSAGTYTINSLPFGIHRLSVSVVGFKKESRTISLAKNTYSNINFKLTEDMFGLNEVVIVGEKDKAHEIRETGFNVNAIETEKYDNTNSDVVRVLDQTAGVRIRQTGGLGSSFNFYLNGLSGKAVKFFIDGQPLEGFGSVFNLNNFPVNMIERVDVYKGAVPVSLGNDALGGAVNIITKQNAKTYLDASYSYGSFNTHRMALTGQWRHSASGFTVKPQFFYNYSDNNYTMHNLKTIRDKQSPPYVGDFKRFLNTYESYLGDVQIGFTQAKWADRFFIGFGYGEVNQDIFPPRGYKDTDGSFRIQTPDGSRQYEENYLYTLQYAKTDFLVKGLDINLSASYSTLDVLTVDTLRDQYNWEGKVIYTDPNRFSDEYRTFKFDQEMFQYTTALAYQLNEQHQLTGSLTWSRLARQNSEEFRASNDWYIEKFDLPQEIDKKILGLAYQNTVLNGKMQTILSGKLYNFFVPSAAENYENQWSGVSREEIESTRRNWGYGLATRYKFSYNWLVKASYEKTYRLPEAIEAFGDGQFIQPNLDLLPENSHNINLGVQYTWSLGENGKISSELGGFYRLMENRIFVSAPAQNAFYSYYNIDGVLIKGLEGELRYSYKNKFSVGANATYQDVLNDAKYMDDGDPNFVYRDRMYNTPFFFGNADVSYSLNELTKANLNLMLFYNAGYVSEFFLNYPSIAQASKRTIPTQFIQDIGVTVSSRENRYHLTLECRNFLDALAYDDIAMQKPGRAVYIKLRYFLSRR